MKKTHAMPHTPQPGRVFGSLYHAHADTVLECWARARQSRAHGSRLLKHALAVAASRGGSARCASAHAQAFAGRCAHTRPQCSRHLSPPMPEEGWRGAGLAMRRCGDAVAWWRGWRRGGVAAWRRGGVAAWWRGGVVAWLGRTAASWLRDTRAVRKEPVEKPLELEQPRTRRLKIWVRVRTQARVRVWVWVRGRGRGRGRVRVRVRAAAHASPAGPPRARCARARARLCSPRAPAPPPH